MTRAQARRWLVASGLLPALLLSQSDLRGANNLYWDSNGTTAGSGAAAGTWGSSVFWSTDPTGVGNTFTATTAGTNDVFFSAGTNGTTGTVAISGTQFANSITFQNNVALTLSGGTGITLGGGSTPAGISVLAGDNAANAISTAVSFDPAATTATFSTAGTGVLTVSGGITGTTNLLLANNSTGTSGITLSANDLNNTGTVTNAGTGTGGVLISSAIGSNVTGAIQSSATSALTLSGANTYTGSTTIAAGTLNLTSTGSINSSSGLIFNGSGAFTYAAGASTVAQLQAVTFSSGNATVTSTFSSGTDGITIGTLNARSAGATANFVVSTGTNGVSNSIVASNLAPGFIDQGTFFNGNSYAWVDSTGLFIRGIAYGTDPGAVTSATTASLAGDTVNPIYQQFTGAITAQQTATFTTLHDSGANAFTLAAGATVTTNGILKSGGSAATISGGVGIQAATDAELVIRTDIVTTDVLTISTPILANGTNRLTKTGAGTLIVNAVSTLTGAIAVNQGTLQILDPINSSSGNDTVNNFQAASSITVNNGAALTFTRTYSGGGNTNIWNVPTVTLNTGATVNVGPSNGTINSTFGNNWVINGNSTFAESLGNFGNSVTFTGALSGSGALTFTSSNGGSGGGHTLSLTTASPLFTGGWIVNGSTAANPSILSSGVAGALGTGPVTVGLLGQLTASVASGLDSLSAVNVAGTTAIFNPPIGMNSAAAISVSSGVMNIGTAASTGVVTVGSLALSGGTINLFPTATAASTEKLAITGGFTSTGGTVAITFPSAPAAGTYTVLTYGGALTGTPTITGLPRTATLAPLTGTNGSITFTVVGSTGNLIWTGAVNNTFDINTTANFSLSAAPATFFNYDNVTFDETAGTNLSPSLASGVTIIPTSITFNNSTKNYTLSGAGVIAGAATLTKNGTGTATISSTANTFTGAVAINAGTLSIASVAANGSASSIGAGTTLSLGSTSTPATLSYTGGSATLGKAIALGTSGGSIGVTTAATNLTAGGVISGTGPLTKIGTGSLFLTGTNTMTGPLIISAGTVQVGAAGTAGALAAAQPVSIASGATLGYSRTDTSLITVANPISGAGAVRFTGSGTASQGQYALTGENNFLTGTVIAASGRVQATNAAGNRFGSAALSNTGTGQFFLTGGSFANNFTVSGTGWLETAGNLGAIRFGGGTIAGSVTITGNTRITAYNSTGTLSGGIKQSGATPLNVEFGAATGVTGFTSQVLTLGGASTYTGTTSLTIGSLNLLGTLGATAVTIADGAGFGGPGSIATGGSLTLGTSAGATLLPDARFASTLTVGGNVTANGTTTVNLTPGTNLTAGTAYPILNYTGTFTGNVSNFTLTGAANYRSAIFANTGSSITVNLGTKSLTWAGTTGALTWDADTTSNWKDQTTASSTFHYGDVVNFTDAAGTGSGAVALNGALTPGGIVVNNSTLAYTLSSGTSGSITGGGNLVKKGTGTLTITMANTYTGGTTISAGEVDFSVASALGTGTITLGDSGTGSSPISLYLVTNRTISTVPIVVSSLATGTVTIGSKNSVGSSGANNSFSNITLQRDVIFDTNAADRTDFGAISGTGNITLNGTGRVIFSAVSTFLGNITVNNTSGNGLQLGAATGGSQNFIPDTSSVTVNSGAKFSISVGAETIDGISGAGTLTVNSITAILTLGAANGGGTFTGPVSGTLGLTKVGTGTQIFSGSMTNSGATTVQNGLLRLNGTLTASAVTVGDTSSTTSIPTLAGSGTISGAVTIKGRTTSPTYLSSGHLAPGNGGAGTLTVGSLTMEAGSVFDYEFKNDGNDLTSVTSAGGLNIVGGGFNLFPEGSTAASTYAFPADGVYHLIRYTGTPPTLASLTTLSVLNPASGVTYNFQLGSDVFGFSYVDLAVGVPEPTSIGVLGLAVVGLLARRRRRA